MRKDFTPHRYQEDAIAHLLDTGRAALWAGMGMGKTVSTLTYLEYLRLSGELDGPVLVCAPLRVAQSTWPDEVQTWKHLENLCVQPIVGKPEERLAALRNKDANIFTINYENLPWLSEALDGEWPFRKVVADESTKLKSFRGGFRKHPKSGKVYFSTAAGSGKRAKTLARVAHTRVDSFIELTGTPSPNGLPDLWGQAWFLDAGKRLGRTYKAFKQRWFQKTYDGFGLEALPHAQREIEMALQDICLSQEAGDYLDIKEPITVPVKVELPKKARDLYRKMEKEMFIEIEQDPIEVFNAAGRTNKCLQLANGCIYVDSEQDHWKEVHDIKLQALEEIIEDAGGTPVLVAYRFRTDLVRLRKAFPKGRVLDKDPQTLRDWNAGKIPILFAHPASAGHGLNLQHGGNILVFFALDWNLENHLQIIERIGPTRQLQAGYERPVYLYYIMAHDTVDELVYERLQTKREVQDILMEAMKRKLK